MNHNVGSTDRIVRVVAALLLVVAAATVGLGTGLGIAFVVVAAVLAATAAAGFCPLYRLLHVSTACSVPQTGHRHS